MFKLVRYGIGCGPLGLWSLSLFRGLNRSQWFDRGSIEALQFRKLGRLLQAAKSNVPYWQNVKTAGGGDMFNSTQERLRSLPILTKSALRQQPASFLARNYSVRSLYWYTTGGTTGEPIKVAKNPRNVAMVEAALLRGRSWMGVKPGDCVVDVKGYEPASWAGKIRMRILNQYKVDAYGLQREADGVEINFIHRLQPEYLTGYPTSILRFLGAQCPRIPSLRVIFTTGEMLYPEQRAQIEQAFGVKVSDHYGCNEIGSVAFECEHGVKHVTEEHVLVEALDDHDRPVWDNPGRLVLTDLDNLAMPLIRYEIGDTGVLSRERCACGRSSLSLKFINGRTQDALRSRDGSVLPSLFLASHFRDMEAIKAYQITQHDFANVTLKFVPTGQPGLETDLAAIRDTIVRHLGGETRIKLERCQSIPLTARGKTRLIMGLNS